MGTPELIFIISRLATGALAAFLAILLWSGTRDLSWMFIVMGTILFYAEIMYTTFGMFGIVSLEVEIIPGILGIDTVLSNVPLLCYSIAFIIMIHRNRIR